MSKQPQTLRGSICILALIAGVALFPFAPSPRKLLLWNASASVPIGLYRLASPTHISPGDLVVMTLPAPAADIADRRGYLPKAVPLIKPAAAVSGQTVCRCGDKIKVDNVAVGVALLTDTSRRPMPVWHGCRKLKPGQIFVMNPAVADSFDGRYFGPTTTRLIIARAIPFYIPAITRQPAAGPPAR